MKTNFVHMTALAAAAALLAACVTFPPGGPPLRAVEADLLAAEELARSGNYDGADGMLLARRGQYRRHTTEWRAYTLKAADLARDAGRIDAACAYRFETNPGEVVHLPSSLDSLEPVGPRQRRLVEAVVAWKRGDYAAAAEGFAWLRGGMDPSCPSWLAVTAAQMAAALTAGALPEFMTLGSEMDTYFGDSRIVLAKQENGPTFAVYVAYRAMAGKSLPHNIPPALRDRLAFFAGGRAEGDLQ